MAILIDVGNVFFVKSKISAVSKEGDDTVTVFLPSTPRGFAINCGDEEGRNKLYEKIKKFMLEDD